MHLHSQLPAGQHLHRRPLLQIFATVTPVAVDGREQGDEESGRFGLYSIQFAQSTQVIFTHLQVSEKLNDAIRDHFRADSATFISSGREDIDVRMLGTGRPFAVQLVNAREPTGQRGEAILARLEGHINRREVDVRVNSLAFVNDKAVLTLNVGQEGNRGLLFPVYFLLEM